MVLLPRVGLVMALNGIREREGVKVFAALHTLALRMSVGEAYAAATGGNV